MFDFTINEELLLQLGIWQLFKSSSVLTPEFSLFIAPPLVLNKLLALLNLLLQVLLEIFWFKLFQLVVSDNPSKGRATICLGFI